MKKLPRSMTAPQKFYINRGLFNELPEYTKTVGNVPYIIADPFIYERTVDEVGKDYDGSTIVEFGGENSQSEIDKHTEDYKDTNAEFIIGIGGGKTMDNAKAVADNLKVPVVIVPTLAASDAPTTSVSVLYSDEGEFIKYMFLPNTPNVVIADLDILVTTPPELFSAGLADAAASWIEGRVTFATDGENLHEHRSSYTGYGMVKFGYETVRKYGKQALEACKDNVVTNAFGRSVEAAVYISGVGTEGAGITAAHAVHNGMTIVEDLHGASHGEKVAFGMIVNLILEGFTDEEIYDLANFFKEIELPLTLEDLGLKEFKEEEWKKVAETACAEEDTMKNMSVTVEPADVYDAIIAADKVLQKVKDGYVYN